MTPPNWGGVREEYGAGVENGEGEGVGREAVETRELEVERGGPEGGGGNGEDERGRKEEGGGSREEV